MTETARAGRQRSTRLLKMALGSRGCRKRQQRTRPVMRRADGASAVAVWASRNGQRTDAMFFTCKAEAFTRSQRRRVQAVTAEHLLPPAVDFPAVVPAAAQVR